MHRTKIRKGVTSVLSWFEGRGSETFSGAFAPGPPPFFAKWPPPNYNAGSVPGQDRHVLLELRDSIRLYYVLYDNDKYIMSYEIKSI